MNVHLVNPELLLKSIVKHVYNFKKKILGPWNAISTEHSWVKSACTDVGKGVNMQPFN